MRFMNVPNNNGRGFIMKRAFYSVAFLALCATFSHANAAERFSPAYIDQISGGRFASIDTAAIVAPLAALARDMPKPSNRLSNLSLILQDGDFNQASVTQQGRGNVGLIRQIGYNNVASIQQSGRGHQALVFQQGRNNTAIISQR